MEYLYAINPYGKKPVLQINKHIGFDSEDGQGVDGNQFSRELFELDCLHPELITSFINSCGGDVKQGYDIFNSIVSAQSPTRTVYQGFGFSTSGWCGMGADTVDAYDYATWMCHLPYNPDNPSQNSAFLNMVANSIATIISGKSGKNGKEKLSYDEVCEMMKNKTYYTAQQLYDKGLIDNIITSSGEIKAINFDDGDVKNEYIKRQVVFNKYIQENFKQENISIMAYPKIVNRLNDFKAINLSHLTEDAGEEVIASHISRIENEFNAVNADNISLKDKLKVLNESQEENQKKLLEAQNAKNQAEMDLKAKEAEALKLKNDMDAMDAVNKELKEKETAAMNKAKEQEDANKLEKAKNLVAPFIGTKIKEDDASAIAIWEKKAVENFEEAKVLLEALPTNFKAPILINAGTAVVEDKSILGHYMAQNAIKHEAVQKEKSELYAQFLEANKK